MLNNEIYIYPSDKRGNRIGHTICVISNGERLFQGEALCSPNDNFSRSVGRKIAKERALAALQRYEQRTKQV